MTLGTEMSSLIGIAGSLFLTIRKETMSMKIDIISILAGIGCAGSQATSKYKERIEAMKLIRCQGSPIGRFESFPPRNSQFEPDGADQPQLRPRKSDNHLDHTSLRLGCQPSTLAKNK